MIRMRSGLARASRRTLTATCGATALLLAAGPALAQVASAENPSEHVAAPVADGADAIAIGRGSETTGDYSVAIGSGAVAGIEDGDRLATAVGFESLAGFWATAVGTYAEATGETSSAFGYGAEATGETSTALGGWAIAEGMWSTAVGGAWARGDETIAIGMGSQTDADGVGAGRSIAIGSGVLVYGADSIAMGYSSIARGDRALSIGTSADRMRGRVFGGLAEDAVALGYGAVALGEGSVAIGVGSAATADDVFSIGRGPNDPYRRAAFTRRLVNVSDGVIARNSTDAVTGGQVFTLQNLVTGNTTAITGLNTRMGEAETAILALENASADDLPIAADNAANADAPEASADDSLAAGWGSRAQGAGSSAFGGGARADGDQSLALGGGWAEGELSLALGVGAHAGDDWATAVGHGATADAFGALALGAGSGAAGEGAVALGSGSVAEEDYTVSVGAAGFERRIVNIADGVVAADSTDAVTGGQLFTVQNLVAANTTSIAGLDVRMGDAETAISALESGAGAPAPLIAADNASGAMGPVATGDDGLAVGWGATASGGQSLALGAGAQALAPGSIALGAGSVADEAGTLSIGAAGSERRIVHVSDGRVAADSSDAVTGGQLFLTRTTMAAALGGGAGFGADGLFTPPNYAILGQTYDNVGGALGALNTQVAANTTDIDAIRTTGGGGTGGGGDDGRDAEIAALRAQVQALGAALDRLEKGSLSGGEAGGDGTTAAGEGAKAQQFGDTAFGAGAEASGDPSTAIGFAALASGQHSTAVGGNTQATGALSTALGQGAMASGDASLALGQGSSAAQANSIAIGQGVQTRRANQVAIGSADHTYTLAGLTSEASREAQSGASYVVTSDAAGNLATMDMNPWFERVEGVEGRMDANDERWRVADRNFRRQADGVAMALALSGSQILQPGQTFAVSASMGHFDGANAAGFGAVGRLNERISLNAGFGAGFRTGVISGRAGISFGW